MPASRSSSSVGDSPILLFLSEVPPALVEGAMIMTLALVIVFVAGNHLGRLKFTQLAAGLFSVALVYMVSMTISSGQDLLKMAGVANSAYGKLQRVVRFYRKWRPEDVENLKDYVTLKLSGYMEKLREYVTVRWYKLRPRGRSQEGIQAATTSSTGAFSEARQER